MVHFQTKKARIIPVTCEWKIRDSPRLNHSSIFFFLATNKRVLRHRVSFFFFSYFTDIFIWALMHLFYWFLLSLKLIQIIFLQYYNISYSFLHLGYLCSFVRSIGRVCQISIDFIRREPKNDACVKINFIDNVYTAMCQMIWSRSNWIAYLILKWIITGGCVCACVWLQQHFDVIFIHFVSHLLIFILVGWRFLTLKICVRYFNCIWAAAFVCV